MKDLRKQPYVETVKKPHLQSKEEPSAHNQSSNIQLLEDLTLLTQQNNQLKKEVIRLRSIVQQSQRHISNSNQYIKIINSAIGQMLLATQSKVLEKLNATEKRLWKIQSHVLKYKTFPMAQPSRRQSIEYVPQEPVQSKLGQYIIELNNQISRRDKRIVQLEALKVLKMHHYQKVLNDLSNLKRHLEEIDLKHQEQKQAILNFTQPKIKSIARLIKQNVDLKTQKISEIETLKSAMVVISQLVNSASNKIASVVF